MTGEARPSVEARPLTPRRFAPLLLPEKEKPKVISIPYQLVSA
jgi:hypothetical protein